MATVVEQADRSKQAVLLVDDEGYLLVSGATGGGGGAPQVITKEVIKTEIVKIPVVEQVEVIREVPVTVIKEVIKEKPVPQIVEIVREVPVEKRIEVIKEVEGPERIVYQEKLVEVVKEVVKTEVKEIIRTETRYPTEQELDALLAAREAARLAAIKAAEEEARRKAEEEARLRALATPKRLALVTGTMTNMTGVRYGTYPGKQYNPANAQYSSLEIAGDIGTLIRNDRNDLLAGAEIPWVEFRLDITPRGDAAATLFDYRHTYVQQYKSPLPKRADHKEAGMAFVTWPDMTALWTADKNSGFSGYTRDRPYYQMGEWRAGVGGSRDRSAEPTATTNRRWVGGHTYSLLMAYKDVKPGDVLWYWNALITEQVPGNSTAFDLKLTVVAYDKKPPKVS